jgi:hypothetical protein
VAPPTAPWPAAIVRAGSDNAFLVDASLLPAGTFGPPAEHVLRPAEVYRTRDGHAVLMPAVTEPVPLGPVDGLGGAVTLAVSMLRGVLECSTASVAVETTGEWWFAPDGRPVFVPVSGGESVREAAARHLRRVDAGSQQNVFDALADDLLDPDVVRLDGWEDRLFGVATATAARPRTAEAPPSRRDLRPSKAASRTARVKSRRPSGIREAASDAGVSLWRAARQLRPRRRVMLIGSATAAAAVVLAVGLTWPETGDGAPSGATVAAEERPAANAADDSAAPPAGVRNEDTPASGSADEAPAGDRDLAAVAVELMDTLRECSDASCRAAVMEDPAKKLPPGAALDGGGTATLVDDLGGIGVVRMDDTTSPGQIVLIVSRDGKWLVRDVYDVADQP